jgi:rhamnulokinase
MTGNSPLRGDFVVEAIKRNSMRAQKNAQWSGLAVDLGASSGRVMRGGFDGARLSLTEVCRFENEPVRALDTLHWDFPRLLHEVKRGLGKALAADPASSVAIDSWAVDFGLLDSGGRLLGNPVHYRDVRTAGMMERVFSRVPRAEIFQRSGLQFLPFNTIYQLSAMRQAGHPHLDQAAALLMIPDLMGYFLTGQKACEFTNATTTQLLDPRTRQWSEELIEKLDLPRRIFLPIVKPGAALGKLLPDVAEELGGRQLSVVSCASHDTACAVAGTPARGERFAYLSCGTWSLLGAETREPVLSPRALSLNFTNEGGVNNTWRLLKNIMGLWISQELKREWERAGKKFTWAELTTLSAQAPAFASLIDPDDEIFLAPGEMSSRIRAACARHGQPQPQTEGALLRCVTESLALKYRRVLEQLEELAGDKFEELHIVGGGIQNELLCQWTANACNRPVLAGPIEASALGNLAVQLIAAGELSSIAEARAAIAASFPVKRYEPQHANVWNDVYERSCKLLAAR